MMASKKKEREDPTGYLTGLPKYYRDRFGQAGPQAGTPSMGWGPTVTSFGATPATPYPNPGYTPGFGYGLPGQPLTSFGTRPPYGPYRYPAGYVQPVFRDPAQGGGGVRSTLTGGDPWRGYEQNMYWGDKPMSAWDLMRRSGGGFGLTEGQLARDYVPGASELNAYGQPLGTTGPLNNRRMGLQGTQQGPAIARRNNELLGWNPGTYGVEKPDNWTQVLTGRTRGKDRRKAVKKAGKSGGSGDGVTPGWVGGMASFNLP
jgi:hypothetical protein